MLDVRVDPQRCEGTGFCARVAPHLFALQDGVAVPREKVVGEEDAEVLAEAETLCPTQAIRARRVDE
jgi:ferredoxin